MTIAYLLQVIAQEASRFLGTVSPKTIRLNDGGTEYDADSGATKTTTGFTLAGLPDGNHLCMAIRKNI